MHSGGVGGAAEPFFGRSDWRSNHATIGGPMVVRIGGVRVPLTVGGQTTTARFSF